MSYEIDRMCKSAATEQRYLDAEQGDLKDNYEKKCLNPDSYDLSNKENIKKFGERVRKARKTFQERQAKWYWAEKTEPSDFGKKPLEKVGKALGCSKEIISEIEKGTRAAIPLTYIRPLCLELQVSSAYLLGFVEDPDQEISIVDGDFERDADGKIKTFEIGMRFDTPACIRAVEKYRELFDTDSDLFWLINQLFYCEKWKIKIIKQKLERALQNSDPVDRLFVEIPKPVDQRSGKMPKDEQNSK